MAETPQTRTGQRVRASRTSFGLKAANTPFDDLWLRDKRGLGRFRRAEDNLDPRRYNEYAAAQLTPVVGAVTAMTRGLAASTLEVQEKKGGIWVRTDKDIPRWCDPNFKPNRWQTRFDFFTLIGLGMLIGGNGFAVAISKHAGYPDHVYAMPRKSLTVSTPSLSEGIPDRDPLYRSGRRKWELWDPYDARGDLLHMKFMTLEDPTMGISPLTLAAPFFRSALAAEAHAETFFTQGGVPPGIMVGKDNNAVKFLANEQNISELNSHYDAIRRDPRNRHKPLFMHGDFTWIDTFVNPNEMQLLDARKFTTAGTSAVYGVPPPLLGASDITSWGEGIQAQIRFFWSNSLAPFITMVSQGLSEFLPADMRIFLNPEHLLAGVPLERAQFYKLAYEVGWLQLNEIRAFEGMDELDEKSLNRVTEINENREKPQKVEVVSSNGNTSEFVTA